MIFESLELEHDTLFLLQQYRASVQAYQVDSTSDNHLKMITWAEMVASSFSRDLEEQGA